MGENNNIMLGGFCPRLIWGSGEDSLKNMSGVLGRVAGRFFRLNDACFAN